METTTFPYSGQQRKGNKGMLFIIVVVLIAAVLIGGYLYTRQTKKTDEVKNVVVENKEPTPTEKPKIDKATVKIQVVNGTGTPGQAGVVVKALENAGYKSDNIKTGNADKFDNSTTSITARDNFEEIVTDIENVLKSTFDKITVASPNLEAKSEFDIVITTGGKIFEAVTPSLSPTLSVTTTPTLTPTLTPTPTP